MGALPNLGGDEPGGIRVVSSVGDIDALRAGGPSIHVVWVGSPPSATLGSRLANWASLNPTSRVALWDAAGLAALAEAEPALAVDALLRGATNHAATSDVARFAVLHVLGGIYVDADMEPCRPISELLAMPNGFLVRESRWLLNAGAIGLPRGARFAATALDLMRVQLDRHGELSNFMCGPPLVTELAKVARSWDHAPTILPEWTFFPVNPFRMPAQRRSASPPYAIHLYDHTWGTGSELTLPRRLARALQLVTPRDVAVGNRRPTQLEIRRLASELG